MNKLTIFLILLIAIGIIAGLYISYKMIKAQRQLASAQGKINGAYAVAESLLNHLDEIYPVKMVFIHHSVGNGIMYKGGLQDSLLKHGVVVRGCTYGDEIGQQTDMNHWLPKFQKQMDKILRFKAHPNKYNDTPTNEIVMFKSCFPNSNITSDGAEPGNPTAPKRTIANYKAVFEGLGKEFAKYQDRLFIYMTAPPNVPAVTTPENAKRARDFNNWLINDFLPKYRKETGWDNFYVYDLFGFLTGDDNLLKPEFRQKHPQDSHPNDLAKKAVAADFTTFFVPILEKWQKRTKTESDNK